MSKRRKVIDVQKVFWSISIAFLLACILFYGGRLLYYHHTFNKTIEEEKNTFYQVVLNANYEKDTLKNVDDNYYFKGKDINNYVEYSNRLFRIVKLNKDGSITLISDKVASNLAMGENKSYSDSYIYQWLNKLEEDNTGIFINSLNDKGKYLTKSETCLDIVDEASNKECLESSKDSYVTLLSISDYVNTGNIDSFINNGQYFYLSDNNNENKSWYINSTGKLGTGDGSDIYGIKPVITLKKGIELVGGDGSIDNPYKFESEKSVIGSYVKLENDIWRVYQASDGEYKLVLNDYLMVDDEKFSYNYSKKTYEYNENSYGSLAYYLNNTYYKSLSYKDIIVSSNYSNGYYEKDDYKGTVSAVVEAMVGIPSVGDIILNDSLSEYYMATGNIENGKMVYIGRDNGRLVTKSIGSSAYVVPCITISKSTIVNGDGSLSNPYGME